MINFPTFAIILASLFYMNVYADEKISEEKSALQQEIQDYTPNELVQKILFDTEEILKQKDSKLKMKVYHKELSDLLLNKINSSPTLNSLVVICGAWEVIKALVSEQIEEYMWGNIETQTWTLDRKITDKVWKIMQSRAWYQPWEELEDQKWYETWIQFHGQIKQEGMNQISEQIFDIFNAQMTEQIQSRVESILESELKNLDFRVVYNISQFREIMTPYIEYVFTVYQLSYLAHFDSLNSVQLDSDLLTQLENLNLKNIHIPCWNTGNHIIDVQLESIRKMTQTGSN